LQQTFALNSLRDHRYQKLEMSIDAPLTELRGRRREAVEVADNIDGRAGTGGGRAQEDIRHAIEKLPEKQRAAVLLHKYQELDYAEIAKNLSCSDERVKSLLFRAYEMLRVELAPLVRQGKEAK